MTRRRGRRRKKLLDDLKDRRGYCQLKEEALDRSMWRNRFGRGFGPVVWQITDDDDDDIYIYIYTHTHTRIGLLIILGPVGPHLREQNPTIRNLQVLNLDSPRSRYSSCTAPEPVSIRSNVTSFSNLFFAVQMTASRLFRRSITPWVKKAPLHNKRIGSLLV